MKTELKGAISITKEVHSQAFNKRASASERSAAQKTVTYVEAE